MSVEENVGANGNGRPSKTRHELKIEWDSESGEFLIHGIAQGPIVCLGLLEYALVWVKRHDASLQAQAAAGRGPGLVLPGGRRT